jgi:hypothetical protein
VGHTTPAAKRARLARASESQEAGDARRAARALTAVDRRAHESQETGDARRVAMASTAVDRRAHESQETGDARRVAMVSTAVDRRAHKSQETGDARRVAMVSTAVDRRAHESQETGDARRVAMASRAADRLAQESHEAGDARRAANAQVQVNARVVLYDVRARETPVQRAQRLATRRHPPHEHVARTDRAPASFSVGRMEDICQHCTAYRFLNETQNCCHNGKVQLPLYNDFPHELRQLFLDRDHSGRNFKDNIRQFNSAMAFASMGATLAPPPGHGPYCFRIHGQIFHRSGDLHPSQGEAPQYAQLYIIEGDQAVQARLDRRENAECSAEVMQTVHNVMMQHNPFAKSFANMKQVEEQEIENAHAQNIPIPEIKMIFKAGSDERRFNEPVHDEVAAVFVGPNGEPPSNHDIVVYPRGRPLQHISHLNRNLDPMLYPLFFPKGEYGWSPDLEHVEAHRTAVRNRVTQMEFYSYRLAMRPSFSPLHHGGKLLQQYLVDAYVKTEGSRLDYIRHHQSDLRVDSYQGLIDHVNTTAATHNLPPGKIVILPSSFGGSPRHMQHNFQDAMAVTSELGRPDLFVTFTCNPKCPDILNALRPGQTASYRPDIVSRVFKLQLEELKKDIMCRNVLGETVSDIRVIEFQKRGLPHTHMLFWFAEESKLRTPEDVDSVVRAEIPDPATEPDLYELVKAHMIHGPCGDLHPECVCMKDGVCSKGFPKEFRDNSFLSDTAYPLYMRRDNGRTLQVRRIKLDNWVVPYNPWLLLKFGSHINVEICSSVKSIKYIFKYVFKGHDC